MNKTNIEWVKNPDGTPGYTWNPITGCNNQIDGMCQGGNFPCYAYKLANGRLRTRYLANKNTATRDYDEDSYPFYPRLWEWRILEPRDSSRGKGIFVCNMSDLFGIGIPEEWTKRVLKEIPICHDNRFYLLTKQASRLSEFSPFPDNAWVGVSVTNELQYVEAYGYLKDVEAKVKFYSFEPLLERVRVSSIGLGRRVQGVIIGSQTKPTVYPKIEWVQEIVEACDKAKVAVFLKDSLLPLIKEQPLFQIDKSGFILNGDLRQEMPELVLSHY